MSGYVQTNQPVILPDAAYTVSAADTGKILLIPNLTASRVYKLPGVTGGAGLHYVFQNQGLTGAFDATVNSFLLGTKGVLVRSGVAVSGANGATGSINFIGGTSLIGDRAEFYCDGSIWSVVAYSNAGAGITAT